MKDLMIDEEFDIPTTFDGHKKDEYYQIFLENCEYDINSIPDDELDIAIMDGINEHLEDYTHLNGLIYVEDWDVFDSDLFYLLNSKVEKLLEKYE